MASEVITLNTIKVNTSTDGGVIAIIMQKVEQAFTSAYMNVLYDSDSIFYCGCCLAWTWRGGGVRAITFCTPLSMDRR